MPTAAEIKTRAEMDKLRLRAAAEELKGRVESAKRRSDLQQRMINVAAKLAGDKKKEEEKAEKEAKIPLEPTPTPFNLQNVISGKESGVPQVAMDTERGMPSDGGGQLGQVIRDAMGGGSAPLTQRQTSVEWAPHPYGFGYVPMPTRRTTTTEIPTGMTQYQRAMLAQRQMEAQAENKRLEARNYWLNQQTQREMAALKRQELVSLAARFGSVDDALAFMNQDAGQMTPELRGKAKKAIEAELGRKVKHEELNDLLALSRERREWIGVSKPAIGRKVKAGAVTRLSQIGLDELVLGVAPLGTTKEMLTAEKQLQIGLRQAVGWTGVEPERLYLNVGIPATHLNKMVVAIGNGPGAFTQAMGLLGVTMMGNREGFGLVDAQPVFHLMDVAIRSEDRDERDRARNWLKAAKVVGKFDPENGTPYAVPSGMFKQTSEAYIEAYKHLKQVQAAWPELEVKDVESGIVTRRLDESAQIQESIAAQRQLYPEVQKEVVDNLTRLLKQTLEERW